MILKLWWRRIERLWTATENFINTLLEFYWCFQFWETQHDYQMYSCYRTAAMNAFVFTKQPVQLQQAMIFFFAVGAFCLRSDLHTPPLNQLVLCFSELKNISVNFMAYQFWKVLGVIMSTYQIQPLITTLEPLHLSNLFGFQWLFGNWLFLCSWEVYGSSVIFYCLYAVSKPLHVCVIIVKQGTFSL